MFHMVHRTSRHSVPKMDATFKKVRELYRENKYFTYVSGRKAVHKIKDPVAEGQMESVTQKIKGIEGSVLEEEDNVFEIERTDLELD
jgi:hypothetical protein